LVSLQVGELSKQLQKLSWQPPCHAAHDTHMGEKNQEASVLHAPQYCYPLRAAAEAGP
jgi:hypothetical protein